MALPLGHAMMGVTVACLGRERPRNRRADAMGLLAAVIITGLPDLDFILYWTLSDLDFAYQLRHGPSHSLLVGGVLAGIFCLLWRPFGSRLRTFGVAWTILATHAVLDGLYQNTPVALFWPIIPETFFLWPLLPDVEIHGDMRVLVSRVFIVHLLIEGLIGTIIAVPTYLLTRRYRPGPAPTIAGITDETAVS